MSIRDTLNCVCNRALNWQTGETVAVKQIALGNIPPSELPEIMVRHWLPHPFLIVKKKHVPDYCRPALNPFPTLVGVHSQR